MPFLRVVALAASASLLAGCSVGPDYQRPTVPLAERYTGRQVVGARNVVATADFKTWWECFNDPEMSALVDKALAQNLDLARAQARVTQARAGLGAANAALLPSATSNGQAARVYQSVETPLGRVLRATPDYNRYGNNYEMNLNASWELDLFGGLRRGREAALADYQASEAGFAATRLSVAAQTADIYISIRGLQTRLRITQRQVDTQQDLLSKVRLLQSKGLAAEFQVHQTEGELSQVRASMPVLQAALDAAINALDVMLGTSPGTHRAELNGESVIPRAPQLIETGSPADLLRRRPDLIAAESRLKAANAHIGESISEYYPKFSLGGLLGTATTQSGNLFSSGAAQSAGVLGLRWRLFDFGRINAQIEQARGQEAEALAAYRFSVLAATEDVENALSTLVNREAQATILTAGETSLRSARLSSFIAYQAGAASLIDVLNADETLLRASDAKVQAQTESARAAIAAFRALGGGWDPLAQSPSKLQKKGLSGL